MDWPDPCGIPETAVSLTQGTDGANHEGLTSLMWTDRPLDRPGPGLERVAEANGFSLRDGVSCEGHQRNKHLMRVTYRY